jgi:ferredoxin
VIRPYLLDAEEVEKAPEGFVSVPAKGAKEYAFSRQISDMDCTGCGSCVASCPLSGKALRMERVTQELTLTPAEDLRMLPASLTDRGETGQAFRQTAADIAGLGASAFVMQFTNSLVNIVCNSVLSSFGGELYVSIMTVVNSVRQITETPVLAIAEGASPVISYNYGAGRPQKVRRGIFLMAAMGLFYTAAVWILIERFPSFFIGIFSTDSTFMADAIPALHTYFFAFVFMALQYTGQTTFKALGKKRHAIFFSLFRKVVIVVQLTILLPRLFGLGTTGVFMAEPISNVIGGTACFVTMLLTVMPELGS